MGKWQKVVFVLILIQLILVTINYFSYRTETNVCVPSFDCSSVQNSVYSSILGIPLYKLGLFSTLALLILFIYARDYKTLFLIATSFGAVFALYFLYIQFIVLKAVCSTCLFIDTTMLAIFGATLMDYISKPKQ